MNDTVWTITHQDTTTVPYTFGTISANGNRWYGRRDDDDAEDWSAWIDNNPPVIHKKSTCAYNEHQWADTGMAKTWCKKCDLNGRWVMGNVEIIREEQS
jgi:hypothetical protein